jgi:hypothetical protein
MGWKSSIDITRKEAKRLIMQRLLDLDGISDSELENRLEELGYGDNPDLEHFGYNFIITD